MFLFSIIINIQSLAYLKYKYYFRKKKYHFGNEYFNVLLDLNGTYGNYAKNFKSTFFILRFANIYEKYNQLFVQGLVLLVRSNRGLLRTKGVNYEEGFYFWAAWVAGQGECSLVLFLKILPLCMPLLGCFLKTNSYGNIENCSFRYMAHYYCNFHCLYVSPVKGEDLYLLHLYWSPWYLKQNNYFTVMSPTKL